MKKFLLLTLIFCGLFCPNAFSAENPTQEAQQQLVSQAETFREEVQKPVEAPEKKAEIVSPEEKPAAEEEKAGPEFFIKEIKLEGNTLFSAEELKPLWAPYENRTLHFSELKILAKSLTEYYRSRGYTTSRAFVPPQKIENGVVIIKILEGRIHKVSVEGNKYFDRRTYEDAVPFRQNDIFHYPALENSLYFLNQKADREVKAYLMPGETLGASDIVLKVKETNPLHAFYELNNHGTKLTHRARSIFHLDHNNLTGHEDILNSGYSTAEEGAFNAGFLAYSYPLEKRGTTLRLETSYAKSKIVKHFKSSDISGGYLSFSPSVSQVFIKRPDFMLEGLLSFEMKDSKTLLGDSKLSFDRIRMLSVGPQMTWRDRSGKTFLTSELHWGIPGFLGSLEAGDPHASIANSGGEFHYYTVSAIRVQRLPGRSFLLLKTSGQWTNNSLPSPEQYRAGGAFTVRGYPESEAIGDYGYNLSAEYQIPAFFFPDDWIVPRTELKWKDAIRLVGFVDAGKTFLREKSLPTDTKDKFLLGAGFGVRVDIAKNFSLQTDLGFPLGDRSSDENQKQVHVTLKGGF